MELLVVAAWYAHFSDCFYSYMFAVLGLELIAATGLNPLAISVSGKRC
jgi:hypothetical protein